MNLPTPFTKKWLAVLFSVILMAIITPQIGNAQQNITFSSSEDMDAEIISKVAHGDAEAVLTTREGSVDLLLTHDMIVLQFTDQFLQDMTEEIEESEDISEASFMGDLFRSMMSSGIRSLLDHALGIPLLEIEKIYYEDSRLVIINREGEEIFEDLEINDVQVMEDFSRWDAAAFISETQERMK